MSLSDPVSRTLRTPWVVLIFGLAVSLARVARARARDFLLAHNPRDSIRHRNSPRAHILETVRDPFMAFSGGLYAAARRD